MEFPGCCWGRGVVGAEPRCPTKDRIGRRRGPQAWRNTEGREEGSHQHPVTGDGCWQRFLLVSDFSTVEEASCPGRDVTTPDTSLWPVRVSHCRRG